MRAPAEELAAPGVDVKHEVYYVRGRPFIAPAIGAPPLSAHASLFFVDGCAAP